MTENLAVLVCITEKFTPKKCMTQCVTLCMTQNVGATLLKIGVYDTKMYDTKCKTVPEGPTHLVALVNISNV